MNALDEYKAIYFDEESDPVDIDKPTKELAEQWLDEKIEALKELYEFTWNKGYPLTWGKFNFNRGEWETEIRCCDFCPPILRQVHIYRGIHELVELLEIELTETEERYFFRYKDCTVFQLKG